MPSISEPLPERDDDRSRSEHLDEEVPLPLVLEAVCNDCGTTTRLGHPRGISGADAPGWTCAVCLNPISFSTPSWAWTDRRPTTYNSRPGEPEVGCGECGEPLDSERGLYTGSAAYCKPCSEQVYGDRTRPEVEADRG